METARLPRRGVVTLLLFGSGLCALAYQACWFRMLRMVFGASTQANAAVLAIFMGALGLGSALLGGRAERHKNPLRLYGLLELGVAAGAALTPWLVDLVRAVYLAMGGSMQLGSGAALLARLVLSAVALGVPVFLAGGTLPAAVKAVVHHGDESRRLLAVVYGINTLGAVVGCVLPVFWLFEETGVRGALLLCAAFNAALGLVAMWLAGPDDAVEAPAPQVGPASDAAPSAPPADEGPAMPRGLAMWVAFTTGFIFLMGELVWYRLAAPLLGGSTYTFGVVLAVALLGVGLGGVAYALLPPRVPHVMHLAFSCALEGLMLGLPLAAGDGLADLARFAREWGRTDFTLLTTGWVGMAALLVFPAAVVSGYQFPLLVALLGRGRVGVARDVGAAYAANTLGSITGSLAGGFLLLPMLGAVTLWQVSVLLLGFTGMVLLLPGLRAPRWPALVAVCLAAYASGQAAGATGPTAYWRHRPVGAGRAGLPPNTWNGRMEARLWATRTTVQEVEGVESALGFLAADGLSLITNGKSDGNVFGDAGTQVGLGMIPAAILTARGTPPQNTFVIGLGTGQTAGWLSLLPGMQRVDVAELEPGVITFAKLAAPTNQDVLQRPNVRILEGDGRELLLTAPSQYDLVVSEPSNPYRAGVASLYSHEFYQGAVKKLKPGGVFVQWLQSYELDVRGMRMVVATLSATFEHVQVWSTHTGDTLLLASQQPVAVDLEGLGALLHQAPWNTALGNILGIWSAQDFVARHLANEDFARAWSGAGARLNTDDHPILEFEFARSLGTRGPRLKNQMAEQAYQRGWSLPRQLRGTVDAATVHKARLFHLLERPRDVAPDGTPDVWDAAALLQDALDEEVPVAGPLGTLQAVPVAQRNAHPEVLLVEAAGLVAGTVTEDGMRRLEEILPLLAARGMDGTGLVFQVLAAAARKDLPVLEKTVVALVARLRVDPWVRRDLVQKALTAGGNSHNREVAQALLKALVPGPLLAFQAEETRQNVMAHLAAGFDKDGLPPAVCVDALRPAEEAPAWTRTALVLREKCYRAHVPAAWPQARRDLTLFDAHEALDLDATLPAPGARP